MNMAIVFYPDIEEMKSEYKSDGMLVPRFLFEEKKFRKLSAEAKLLYARLIELESEAAKQKQFDFKGDAYVVMTYREVQEFLNCSCRKAQAVLRELDDTYNGGVNLILKTQWGRGFKTRIYVHMYKRNNESD